MSEAIPTHVQAEHGRQELGLSVETLWVAYLALGGNISLAGLSDYLATGAGFDPRQHNYLAQALNDRYVGHGRDHPIAYIDVSDRTAR